ncbi:MAG: NADH:flavin oxidoreductase [Azospirillaceae bacterium]|nr:NADH:flavin oxidoreductase [Azospirillaceae bacterium]
MTTVADPSVSALFQPFAFGHQTLANRIVMAPMTRQQSPGAIPGANVAAYYRSRAAGGVGLIITEGTTINHPGANGYANVPAFHGAAALAGWQCVVDEVHAAGGRIIPQLWHVGPVRRPGMEPDPAVPGYGPMTIEDKGTVVVKAMTETDIADVVAAFAQAARDAERIGFDGVELHGAHAYLLDSFLWDGSNQRTDGYGGSIANRTRIALEVVRAVRAAVSSDFPIVFRFSQWKMSDYAAKIGNTPDELAQILVPLAEAGVDIFHASTRRFWVPAFENSPDTLAAWTRRLTGKPVIAVGSVGLDREMSSAVFTGTEKLIASATGIAAMVEKLEQGDFDLVAVGRALLAEPQWANKVQEGRQAEIHDFTRDALTSLVA